MYDRYKPYLDKFFKIEHDEEIERYLINMGITDSIYCLVSNHKDDTDFFGLGESKSRDLIEDNVISKINTSSDFLFYIRNIHGKENLEKIWKKLYFLYSIPDYVDTEVSDEEVDFLSNLSKLYPKILENIKGLKLSHQLEIIKRVIKNITKHHDYETAIAVLENVKIGDIPLDEDECLILGLSVRKKVHPRRDDPTDVDYTIPF